MSLLYIQASGVLPSTFSNNFFSEAVTANISILLILHLKVGDKLLFLFLLNQHLVCYILCVSQINYLQVIAVFEIKQITSTR